MVLFDGFSKRNGTHVTPLSVAHLANLFTCHQVDLDFIVPVVSLYVCERSILKS